MNRSRLVHAAAAAIALGACGRLRFDEIASVPLVDAGPRDIRGPGTWTPTPASPLSARVWTNGIWTGAEFVVFGGAVDTSYTPTDTGARFDPVSQTWTSTSVIGTPGPRHTARMVMLNGQIAEYGGGFQFSSVSGGGRYDLASDTWTVMSSSLPGLRIYALNVAIGGRMLTWGGWDFTAGHYGSGFIYDPTLDQWTPMSMVGAPSPRSMATAVWTGSKVIFWGGCDGPMPSCGGVKGDGALYDPATDTWSPMSSVGVPTARDQHTAVWTGSEMIVFGGCSLTDEGGPLDTGAIYSPATDTWRPISTVGAPSPRVDPAGVWVTNKMLVWGDDTGQNDGFLYDPVSDQWSPMALAGTPSPRARFAFAASDTQLFIWGGSYTDTTGAVWTPEP